MLGEPLGQTFGEMAQNCEVFRNIDKDRKELSFNGDFRTGVCWGSFLSFFHFGRLVESGGGAPLHICAPKSSHVATFIQAFIDYADRHPEHDAEQFSMYAQIALIKAFPCPGDAFTGPR